MEKRRFVFRGTVQGVGFRPAVYRTAVSLGLGGFVQNRRSEVVVEAEGTGEALDGFVPELLRTLPNAAHILGVETLALPPRDDGLGHSGFFIARSIPSEYSFPPIPPDLAVCPDCARELFDPADRRYLYPFITCTQCGPRYSILEKTPFDRANTSMADFRQCPSCAAEYGNPGDRRFHSQTNSCPACGPRLSAVDGRGNPVPGDPLQAAIAALHGGKIVCIQGIGGFHIAADPRFSGTMARLRAAKDREKKPFALMARDAQEAANLCVLSADEEALLLSPESPIVIARKRPDAPTHLDSVSDVGTLGVMLPYTPLHLLLFRHPDSQLLGGHLVMTSGNRAGEPIVTEIGQALAKLSDAADLFLFHDRRILFRTDDSIARKGPSTPLFLMRRSRGFVPRLIGLKSGPRATVLGIGGDLKSAPALARGSDAHLSPFIGDLDDPECLEAFESHVHGLIGLYGSPPDLAVHDLHPLYRSGIWAQKAGFQRLAAVQHHHAHALSVMAEHGLEEAAALCFDGTGYGTDGTVWGGEFLLCTRRGFSRLGRFGDFPLPGGDAAVLHPPRIAYAILGPDAGAQIPGLGAGEESMLRAMMNGGVNLSRSSSLGRIFDAAAAVLGLVSRTCYEGEGPIRLEGAAQAAYFRGEPRPGMSAPSRLLPFHDGNDGALFSIDPAPLLRHLLQKRTHAPVAELALLFHEAVASAAAEGARRVKERTGVKDIVLSGGVFQNALLRELLIPPLKSGGFRVFLNESVPPGDGGISIGQVYFVPE